MKSAMYTLTLFIALFSFLLFSCENSAKVELEKYEELEKVKANNINVIEEFHKLLDVQDLEACMEYFLENNKGFMGSSDEPFTFNDMIPFIRMYYTSFQDYKHTIENIFATENHVVAQLLYTGTHSGTFMEIDSTGNSI